MALQTFGVNSNGIGSGIRANLGTTDDAFVDFGATVSSSDSIAILGTGSNHFVNIQGTVTALSYAVYLGGNPNGGDSGNHLLIGSSGYVGSFSSYAVWVQSNDSTVDNRGTIWGGAGFGVVAAGTVGTISVLNSGTIEASQLGISHGSGADVLVVNNSGLIKSSVDAVEGSSGVERVTNTGRISGTIDFGGGNDSYNGTAGHLAGHVLGGGGADLVIGGIDNDWFEGGTENDALTGNGGNDRLIGDFGNDILNGGLGIDRLLGGAGNDKLTGGVGNDIFVFNTALNAAANRDIVTDFNHVADTFQLENAIFTKLGAGVHPLNAAFFHVGAAAADANDYIVYNQATGLLSYDVNGNGAGGAVAFAILTNKPVLAANDFAVI